MAYLFKQKLNIYDLAGLSKAPNRVLIHEPEEYLAALYGHHLLKNEFIVEHCFNLEDLNGCALNFSPKILVFSIDSEKDTGRTAAWLLNFNKNFPEIFIITTGLNLNSDIVKQLLEAGVSSHINRSLSRPQDLPILAKTILNY